MSSRQAALVYSFIPNIHMYGVSVLSLKRAEVSLSLSLLLSLSLSLSLWLLLFGMF